MNKSHCFGKVLWFDDRLGFGAAKAATSEYAYIHYKDINAIAHRTLRDGQEIAFEMRLTESDRAFASSGFDPSGHFSRYGR